MSKVFYLRTRALPLQACLPAPPINQVLAKPEGPDVPFEEEKITQKNGYFMEILNTELFLEGLGVVKRGPEVRKISTSQKDSPSECFMEAEKLVKSPSQIQH